MADPHLPRIRRSPLYDEVAQRLRAYIDVNELKPGDRLLSERDLAQRLGVSRTSVRQALTALRVSGLVEIRHGDGVYITRPAEQVVRPLAQGLLERQGLLPAIIEIRVGLESETARLAARRRTDADMDDMASALVAMEAAIAAGGDGAEADHRFHNTIARASRNDMLMSLMDQLEEPIEQTRRASLSTPGRPQRSLAAHHHILDAIRAQDEDASTAAMSAHVDEVADVAFAPREDAR